ncbi:fatty acid synthase-like [Anticarsia gemmatalis]|uniref:fatty acid synthase-like n=1 Tax=Anticarsia gemmatalis TaxID=129554 RepID=UPI003F75C034
MSTMSDEAIVISGMSGLYPQSRNVQELSTVLYNKLNPVTADGLRWEYNDPELSQYTGKAPGLDRFDAQFFKVHYTLGNNMDAMSRKLLEEAYQAIYDAGVNPTGLYGRRIGVFVGAAFSESERATFYHTYARTGQGLLGCSKTMCANRISYWLNLKGPSLTLDGACCSSYYALEKAYYCIKSGECDAAVVAGCYLCFLPHSVLNFQRLLGTSKDGKSKSFDKNADCCCISDAINVIYLQKAKDALRVYAEVVHVKNEFIGLVQGDTGPICGYSRTPGSVTNFINEFYKEAQVPPNVVEYVEALGSATPEGDKCELNAFEQVYLKDRPDPLLVGSVTSNIGFTQAASGISALTKVLLGYHTGQLAANLHCEHPREDIAALREGRMRIVTEHQRFERTFVAVNGMSFTGINSHVLLHGRYRPKNLLKYSSSIPRLVNVSGRQESGADKVIQSLKSRPVDAEEIALLHNIHSSDIVGHLGRGYVILDGSEERITKCICEKTEYFDDVKRPLWFVYSGMGSQWAGMGAQLMRIPIFAAAIERCQRVLEPKGLDLIHIITSPDKTIFDNILHSFVGIAAVQIGLTDILQHLELKPDGIIGHSVGELGCAYADGCLTAEEMILAAYSRGRVSLETPLIYGSMAAVGLGYEKIVKVLPSQIEVACHNGPDSCTISGPAVEMREFVALLSARGIFAKEVPCSNIAYHSRYIADAGPGLLKYLTEVIKKPKPRSERWLSTSVPQDKWHETVAKMNSAEYHTNNLLGPVLFEETSRLIPSNAVLVEVAPHGLLQAILKRSLSADCRHVPLTRRGHADSVLYLLQAIGDLYTIGYNPQIQMLYPKVEFPVSTGTPLLSQLVEWVNFEKWNMPTYLAADKQFASSCKFVISAQDEEHSYLQGNIVRGKTVFPFAAMLTAVWDTLAMFSGAARREMSVRFQDVQLHVQPALYDQTPLRLHVMLHTGTGRFEVIEENSKVADGFMYSETTDEHQEQNEENDHDLDSDELKQDDLDEFRSIESANASLSEASVLWRDNWVTLIDGMLQLNVLRQQHDAVSLPTYIGRMSIDVDKHRKSYVVAGNTKRLIRAHINDIDNTTRCGGVIMHNISFRNLPPTSHETIELQLFTPQETQISTNDVASDANKTCLNQVSLQIAKPGDVNSVHWVTTPHREISGVVVKVHYAALNILDANKATGGVLWNVSDDGFGMDFSGTLKNGDRVMGIVRSGAASTQLQAQSELLWPVPVHWSLEDAATVPLPYLQALYCLVSGVKARLRRGMSVLIHGGSGALGQAAISVALALSCTVFTTVSDVRKKLFLRQLYPQLKDEYIGNSRDCSFVDMVLNNTQGVGCDIAIVCFPGELRNNTLRCLKTFGITFDLCQLKHRENYYLGMYSLEQDRTYTVVDVGSVLNDRDPTERKMLHTMLSEGITRGYVRPLSRVTYASLEVTRAFRLLAASQHRGRVLLRMQHNMPHAQHRLSCAAELCHLIVSDDEAFCMQIAGRLVNRGARRLYVVTEHLTSHLQNGIRVLRKNNVDVQVFTDINLPEVVNIIERALCTPHPVLLVKPMEAKRLTFLQEIENICDINIPNSSEATLRELGMTDDKAQPLMALLRDSYNLSLEEEDILNLSVDKIQELNEMISEDFKPVSGLSIFFSHLEYDEYEAITDIVRLPTLALNMTLGDDCDPSQSCLCIVPGMEGRHERFRVMCERLKLPALVLQPGLDHPHESLHDTAHRYVEALLEKNMIKDEEFYLLGYESGILVALEVAAILEERGLTGTVFCVGLSPEELQTELLKQLSSFETEQQLQEAVLRHVYTLLAGEDVASLNDALQHTVTWSQKLNACVSTLLGQVRTHSAQYIRALIETALGQIKRVQEYSDAGRVTPLRSRLVLLRAATPHVARHSAALQRHSRQSLAVYQLRASLAHAAYDMRVATIINKYLGKHILRKFEKKNLCNTYFVNYDRFVSKKRTDLN